MDTDFEEIHGSVVLSEGQFRSGAMVGRKQRRVPVLRIPNWMLMNRASMEILGGGFHAFIQGTFYLVIPFFFFALERRLFKYFINSQLLFKHFQG